MRKALECAVKGVDLSAMNAELDEYVSTDSLRHVAALGLRGEVVFPVPVILRKAPFLLGYYRLLLGFSQKEFYSKGPFGRFGRMEKEGRLTSAIDPLLADLCRSLCESMGLLLKGLGRLSHETVRDLQLLTLGPQLRGGANTKVGQKATTEVFGLIAAIVGDHALEQSSRSIIVKNARGQNVLIEFASDPDIAATEKLPSGVRPLVSIEIKGGGDVSNIHNRLGEAEKSHQKAKARGFFEFWTILRAKVSEDAARRESPTTSRFFRLDAILQPDSKEHAAFSDLLKAVLGIR